jgi:simple sugar transport system ATP-binding protein
MTLDELVQMMAGGAELEQLSHELARQMPDSDVARERESDVAESQQPVEAGEQGNAGDEVSEGSRP